MSKLTRDVLLPILQFNQRLAEIVRDYKRKFSFEVVYDDNEWLVTYKFTIELSLGQYEAEVSVSYNEVDGFDNDWKRLTDELNHIEKVINA